MSNPANIDTNINNYTVSELLTILDIDDPTVENITTATKKYIAKFMKEQKPDMISFFQDMQNELLQYATELETSDSPTTAIEYSPAQKQTSNWWNNEALSQTAQLQNNTTQTNTQLKEARTQQLQTQVDKITDRNQKINVYNNQHTPMTREQLGINTTVSVPVSQDILNPNLKNIITRLINIDSQYRPSSNSSDSSTDYTFDLSEPLLNVLSLKLYSIQIPYTWYTFDIVYGNTCFWITPIDPITNQLQRFTINTATGESRVGICVSILPGNYSMATLPVNINQALYNSGFSTLPNPATYPAVPSTSPSNCPVTISSINGKLTINLYGLVYTNPIDPSQTATIDATTIIVFFDPTAEFTCTTACIQTIAINQTLGWNMGFRIPQINVSPPSTPTPLITDGNSAVAVIDLYGTKYLILVLDDYNQNHINGGLIGIDEPSTILKLPSYYRPDMPYTCTRANPIASNIQLNSIILENDVDAGTLIVDKLNTTYAPTQQILPSSPRTLTQSQIYSINEILKNNEKSYNYKLSSPTSSDTFAIIPLKIHGLKIGDNYVEFGGSLQDNKRTYFGPVNITKLRIKLLDDKGNVLNLNGCNWCITIISENLYQY